jgi:putative sigma-54 modulation protein
VEVTLVIDGKTLRTHAAGQTHREGLDEVVDKLERRAVDHRAKPRIRSRPDEEKTLLRQIADGTSETVLDRRVVKTKRFAIEPMFEEDAVGRMEELGHQFFVFVDAETEHVQILYRRNDGNLGLIEPIVAGEYTKGRGRSSTRSNGHH